MLTERSGMSSQLECIAAQFKNAHMRKSTLSPTIIEAALTYIIEHKKEFPQLLNFKDELSYHDRGIMLNDKGVRAFVFK